MAEPYDEKVGPAYDAAMSELHASSGKDLLEELIGGDRVMELAKENVDLSTEKEESALERIRREKEASALTGTEQKLAEMTDGEILHDLAQNMEDPTIRIVMEDPIGKLIDEDSPRKIKEEWDEYSKTKEYTTIKNVDADVPDPEIDAMENEEERETLEELSSEAQKYIDGVCDEYIQNRDADRAAKIAAYYNELADALHAITILKEEDASAMKGGIRNVHAWARYDASRLQEQTKKASDGIERTHLETRMRQDFLLAQLIESLGKAFGYNEKIGNHIDKLTVVELETAITRGMKKLLPEFTSRGNEEQNT